MLNGMLKQLISSATAMYFNINDPLDRWSAPNLTALPTHVRLFILRRLAPILLLLCFASIGTGALEYFHNLEHAAEDAREDAIAQSSGTPAEQHHHDESNCQVHAQLHLPFISAGWVPLLVCLGLFVAFLTLLDTPLIPRLVMARIDCRGPPVA